MHRRVCALYEWVLNLVVRDDGVEDIKRVNIKV